MSIEEAAYSTNKSIAWMSLEENNKKESINGGIITTNRFEIIFRRLVFFLRLMGIPLDPTAMKKESLLLNYWSISFGCISISLDVTLTFYSFTLKAKPTSTSELNVLINEINLSFAMLMTHAGLFFVTSLKWRKLFEIAKRIEKLDFFQLGEYRKFQRICLAGNSLIFLLVL